MANTLFLRLEGPMQSWGERARWSVRDSATEPTKSGLVGLLACALGWSEDDDLQNLSRSIHLGVRCDKQGVLLTDYHTIVGGVLSAEGKIKFNANTHKPETVVSQRTYLHDASFLAAIRAEPALVEKLAHALQNPVWPVYLGRKSCPPTLPVYAGEGDYESLEAALSNGLAAGERCRAVVECAPDEGFLHRDEIDSNRKRTFLARYTHDIQVTGNQTVR